MNELQIACHLKQNNMEPSADTFEYASKLKKYSTLFEAWQEDLLIGLCACYINDPDRCVAYVSHIAVNDTFRRSGVGGHLLCMAINESEKCGFKRVRLEVFKNNVAGIAFYRNFGFVCVEDRCDKYLMEKVRIEI